MPNVPGGENLTISRALLVVHAEARRRGGRQVIHHAVEAVFEGCFTEVDQEADALLHEPHVGLQLSLEDGNGTLDALDLDKDRIKISGQVPFTDLKDIQALFQRKILVPRTIIFMCMSAAASVQIH